MSRLEWYSDKYFSLPLIRLHFDVCYCLYEMILILQYCVFCKYSDTLTSVSVLTLSMLGKSYNGGWCKGAVYLTSPGRPTDIGLQLGKACYPCSG